MYLDGLDPIDQKILALLSEHARLSYSQIGEQVGLSRVAAKARINALEEKGIIESYTTIINPQKISGAVSCYFELECQPSYIGDIVERLAREQIVTQIYRVTGPSALHVHAVAAGQEEMELFIREVMDQLPGVRQLGCQIILSRIKDVKGLRL